MPFLVCLGEKAARGVVRTISVEGLLGELDVALGCESRAGGLQLVDAQACRATSQFHRHRASPRWCQRSVVQLVANYAQGGRQDRQPSFLSGFAELAHQCDECGVQVVGREWLELQAACCCG